MLFRSKGVFLVVVLLGFFGLSLHAQEREITGQVVDEQGVPLVGASVIQKGTNNGAQTDFDGNFSITLRDESNVFIVSFLGFKTVEKTLSQQNNIIITLIEDNESLDEVVIVGYTAVRRADILGSVSSIKEEEILQTTPVNAFDAIQGRLPGVNIASNGGPGSGSSIQIRGVSTFNSGTEPLYVVDGQQVENIDNIDPSDIASIEVLKDGASAAIYGSQSANGVVIVKTKKGKSGKSALDINYSTVYSFVSSHVSLPSTRQRIAYENARGGNDPSLRPRDSLSLLYQNSFDLQELLFRPAVRTNVNAGISGGNDTSDFYWNTGFVEENGVVLNSSYKRVNTQFKINTTLFEKLKVGTSTYGSYELQSGLNENEVFTQMAERIPYFPVFEPDGSWTPEIAGRQNPPAEASERVLDDRNIRARSYNYLQFNILPSLNFKSTIGVDFRLRKRDDFQPTITQQVGRAPRLRERNQTDYNFLQENLLAYRESIGNHNLSALAGTSWQKWDTERTELQTFNLLFDEIPYFNAIDTGEGLGYIYNGTFTDASAHALVGYFGQVNYNYKKKYLIDGTFRRDGTSRTGSNERFGNFKSASIGWRVSGEEFMRNVSWVNNFLLRASYGENGNQSIGDYDNQQTYQPGFPYAGINGVTFGAQLGNPDLKWETTVSKNYGFDLNLFKNDLNISASYFIKTTTDLLDNASLPAESGFSSIRTNVGSVENKGFELDISATPIRTKNFEWFTSFNISSVKNKVLDVADERGFFDSDIFRIQEGQPIGNIFGFKYLGVFAYDESNAFTDNGVQLTPNFDGDGNFTNYSLDGQDYNGTVNRLRSSNFTLGGGDIIWKDLNGDFDINPGDDRQVIGNGLVDYFGGFFNEFKYNNLSFSFLFDYNLGNDIFREYEQTRNDLNSSNETPSPERIDGAWLEQGDVTQWWSLSREPEHRTPNALLNSFWVSKGDYVRLRTVKLAYRLDRSNLDKIGLFDDITVYLSANNVAMWTNYEGFNPDFGTRGNALQPGVDNLRYPNKTDIIFGLNLKL
tara:strand:- start:2787 stop:5879 length:3093 start_codon:yes stop_codon:yes gene_type:complete